MGDWRKLRQNRDNLVSSASKLFISVSIHEWEKCTVVKGMQTFPLHIPNGRIWAEGVGSYSPCAVRVRVCPLGNSTASKGKMALRGRIKSISPVKIHRQRLKKVSSSHLALCKLESIRWGTRRAEGGERGRRSRARRGPGRR